MMRRKSYAASLFTAIFILLISYCEFAVADTAADQMIVKGRDFYQRGDFEHAALAWEQALSLLDAEKHTNEYLDTIVHLARAYHSLGYHEKALKTLDAALPIVEKNRETPHNAQLFSTLGDVHLSLGHLGAADKYLSKALKQARDADIPRILISVLTDVGNLLASDHDYEGAAGAYTECLNLADESDARELKSKPLINLLHVTYLNGQFDEIDLLLDEAFSEIINLPDSIHKATDLIALALIAWEIRNDPQLQIEPDIDTFFVNAALESLDDSARIAQKLKSPRLASYAFGHKGNIYEDENRVSDAIKLTRRAIFFAQQGDFPQTLYLWQWQLGRLLSAQGDIENAVKAYKQAVSTLNPIRGELFQGLRMYEDTFRKQIKPVYLGLTDLLLKQAEEKKSEEKLKEARDTMELLKTAELEDFFEDECVTLMKSKIKSLDRTPPHTAIIYPIVLPERLVLLLTLPDTMKQVSVPIDSEMIEETVRHFRWRLQNRMNNRFLFLAEQLYDWVIRPIEAELQSREISTLVIAPDGALRLIPLTTLNDGKEFLIQKYAMAVIPAVTLTEPTPFKKENIEILLSGLSEGRQGFSPLPSVVAELRDIKKIMNGKVVIMNKEFNKDNLRKEFKRQAYSILHIATHGVFGGTPDESFLLNYDTKLTMNGLEDLISLSKFRDRPVELLTLSACQTALGNERAALGLAGVAVKAGVRSAIATLWYVDDEATSLAIREFYRQLRKPGISKAAAMQNTQKKLIDQRRYWHPLYWAPFLLIGNWM